MFVVKEASHQGEAQVGPRFASAAEAHYFLLKHVRRRYPRRGYDDAKRVYWGRNLAEDSAVVFFVTGPDAPPDA